MDDIKVRVAFTKIADDGTQFSDALYYDLNDFNSLKPADLELAKQGRFNNWLKALEDSKAKTPPTKDEELTSIATQKKDLEDQILVLESRKAEIENSTSKSK